MFICKQSAPAVVSSDSLPTRMTFAGPVAGQPPSGWFGLEALERRLMLSTWYVGSVTDPLEDGSAAHPFDSV